MQPDTYMNQNITKLKYRTSSKNSAPLIIRHPSAESGQITSIIRRGDSQKLQNLVDYLYYAIAFRSGYWFIEYVNAHY